MAKLQAYKGGRVQSVEFSHYRIAHNVQGRVAAQSKAFDDACAEARYLAGFATEPVQIVAVYADGRERVARTLPLRRLEVN